MLARHDEIPSLLAISPIEGDYWKWRLQRNGNLIGVECCQPSEPSRAEMLGRKSTWGVMPQAVGHLGLLAARMGS
jgi:hypothetical protein